MISSKLGAIAFIAAIGVASPAVAQGIYRSSYMDGGSASVHNNQIAADYTYNPRPAGPFAIPIRGPTTIA
jgi:hypothetical protein